jgi:hypothetical protein
MNYLEKRWSQWSPRQRLYILAIVTWGGAVLATLCLLRKDGVRDILYKAF